MDTSQQKRRCVIIGAGVSGILMACKLETHLGEFVDFHVLEKNPELGGTWYENRYPGCACDVPSHSYQYSFAPNPSWSKIYSPSEEIQAYLKKVVSHFGLEKRIQYGVEVVSADWDEASSTWAVGLKHGTTMKCDVLINAGGILHKPRWPEIEGLDRFKGALVHTAAWDKTLDLAGKTVGLVGSGSSAIQVLPHLQPICSSIRMYIRTPAWIAPSTMEKKEDPGPSNRDYTSDEKASFRQDPESYAEMRSAIDAQYNGIFPALFKSSPEQRHLRQVLEARMRSLVRDEALRDRLVPRFEVGCGRVNPHEDFLRGIQEENVTPVFDAIEAVTQNGIVSGGVEHPVDAIVAATGFDNSFRPRFPLRGRHGVDLADLWAEDPVSYFGTAVAGFPNYLTFLGPNTHIANGAFMGPLESTSDYFIRLLQRAIRFGASTFDVRPEAQADFDRRIHSFMGNMAWTGSCRSWYKSRRSGKVTALWPGSSLHYMQVLAEDRWEDYDWTYRRPRYEYWSKGLSWIEDPEGDRLGVQIQRSRETMTTIAGTDAHLAFYIKQTAPLPE
uniref:Putative FAD-containing monooxygenase n=1 Tax=Claviceps paspali TaxID=40601 RepID=G8GV74_CLAPA|nr:putative FAD-containing monooxygenase [Claviceps paspali]